MAYEYTGSLIRVIDGDTVVLSLTRMFTMQVDFGFYIKDDVRLLKSTEMTFRLLGVDAPEMKKPTLAQAKAAKAFLQSALEGKHLRVVSHKPDKYGRWLADVYVVEGESEIDVSKLLVESGHAVPYVE